MSIVDDIINSKYDSGEKKKLITDCIINGTYNNEKKKRKEEIVNNIINGTYRQKKIENNLIAPINTTIDKNKIEAPIIKNEKQSILPDINTFNIINGPQQTEEISKKIVNKNLITGMASSNETQNAANISVKDIEARGEAIKKNENINKGGIEAFNEYLDSTLNAIPGGVKSVVAGLGNVATTAIGADLKKINSIIKNDKIDEMYDNVIDAGKELAERGNYENKVNSMVEDDFTRNSANVINTVSQMLTTAGIGAVIGVPGTTIQGLYVGGSSAQEVLNENKDNIVRAGITGLGKGFVSYLTEKMFDANILTKGMKKTSIQNNVNDFIARKFSSKLGQKIADKSVGIIGENIEEFIEDNIDNLIDKLVNNKDMPGFKEWLANTSETAKITTMSTIVLSLLGLGGGNIEEIQKDAETQKWINEAEKIIKNENMAIVYDSNTQNMLNQEQNTLQKDDSIGPLDDKQQRLQEELKKTASNKLNLENNEANQVLQSKNNTQLDNILNNKEISTQNYQYKNSDNEKINNLRQDANKYFNNSEQASNFVNMLEKIITDKNIDIRLDGTLTDNKGNFVNGKYENGVITINPNSTKAGEFIAIHELTHAIGTKEMLNIINTYRNSNTEFDSAVKNLLQNYEGTEISEEALSDVSAQLFGNQEFINNIAQNNPNIFQKIYNEIKYLWHQFRGYKNQNQFIEDLYYKWTQAYNSNNKLNETNNYSFAGRNAKTANIRNLVEAVKLEEQGKNAQEIYEKTGWYRGNETKWRFEIADNNFNIKNGTIKKDGWYRLNEILDAPELYNAYPELEKTEIYFEDLDKNKNAYAIPEKNRIYINNELIRENDSAKSNKMLGLKNQNEIYSILTHEIQHIIQQKEEFSRGSSEEYWYRKQKQDATEYAESLPAFEKLKTATEKAEFVENFVKNNVDKYTIYSNYRNTAGEQEARNAQERINMKDEYRKRKMPFIKNEETVYAQKSEKNYHISENFSNEIDKSLRGEIPSNNQIKARDYTPKILVENGVKDLPMLLTQKHLKQIIYTQQEAIDLKYKISEKDHYHGLGKETLLRAIDNLDNPKEIYKQSESNYLIITEITDKYNNKIIVPIKIKGKGTYNNMIIDENQISSVYGHKNLENYLNKNNFEKIYEKNRDTLNEGVISHNISNSTNSIPPKKTDVNTTTKYSIQESENNSGFFNWQEYLENNFKQNGTTTNLKEIAPIRPNIIKKDENIENNKKTMYNSFNESEGDIYDTTRNSRENNETENIRKNKIENNTSTGKIGTNQTEISSITEQEYNILSKEIEKAIKNEVKEKLNFQEEIIEDIYNKIANKEDITIDDIYKSFDGYRDIFQGVDQNIIDEVNEIKKYLRNTKIDISNIKNEITDWNDFRKGNFGKLRLVNDNSALKVDQVYKEMLSMYPGYFDENISNPVDQLITLSEWRNIESEELIKPINYKLTNNDLKETANYILNATEYLKSLKDSNKSSFSNLDDIAPVISNNVTDIAPAITPPNHISPNNDDISPIVLKENKKVMNPTEISNLKPKDASTTPQLSNKRLDKGNKESSFYKNITQTSQAYNETARKEISNNDNVKYYQSVTNEQSLQEATKRLDDGGESEVINWVQKESKNANATDVAEGWILLKRYQDIGDYNGMVEVAKKMRDIATKSGQTVQMFNLMSRMTPEGMIKYAQSELSEAFEKLSKNKTKKWIDENKLKFDLVPNEVEFIVDNMNEIEKMNDNDYTDNKIKELKQKLSEVEDKSHLKEIKQEIKLIESEDIEYLKKVKLAEIQKMISDKIPPNLGESIKSWMRISMLFNIKTQVRNVLGNAVIMPVNSVSDIISTTVDKAISKKTGVRTTGLPNVKSNLEGFKKGIKQSFNDFKKGINTRDIEGNRFEISNGKSFTEKTIIGKTLNRIDSLNSFLLDVGDRGFYEAAFTNSINNQMALNKTDIVTKDMIDIASSEALSRTWQDNNNYTKFVLTVRNGLSKIGIESYGLGDVLVPFAKTPANLTKAIIDYSPAGLVKTIVDGVNLKRGLLNGQYTSQLQHKFVQDLGKATAGTMLCVLGTALAKAGITSGDSDDDKDVNNFIKNTLGVSSYSIKINGHSFTYDWAQPIAAPLSITANIVNSNKKETALMEAIVGSLDTAGSILLEQSFLQSINDVLTNNDGVVSGLVNEILELPSRAIPTFMKQIVDMTDSTARQSYVAGKPIETAINSLKAKIPGVSKTLAPSVDTLGNEIQKYGGENTFFNVLFNPANVNSQNLNKAGSEIYRLYEETGDKTIMPRVAPYSINYNNEKIQLTSSQRADFQKMSGEIVQDSINNLLNNKLYLKLEDSKKAEILTDISNYAYNKAQSKILGTNLSDTYQSVEDFISIGGKAEQYYTFKNNVDDTSAETKKSSVINTLLDMKDLTNAQKANLYGKYYSSDKTLNVIVKSNIDFNEYLKYYAQDIEADYNSNGKAISGSKKNKVVKYVNSLPMNVAQKAILIKSTNSFKFNDYNNEIVSYVKSLNNVSYKDKKKILEDLDMTVSSNGTVSWKK